MLLKVYIVGCVERSETQINAVNAFWHSAGVNLRTCLLLDGFGNPISYDTPFAPLVLGFLWHVCSIHLPHRNQRQMRVWHSSGAKMGFAKASERRQVYSKR